MMTFCLLPKLNGYKRLGEPKAAVEYDPMDLIYFIAGNWGPLNLMMERAGMSELDIYNRSRDVFLHYKPITTVNDRTGTQAPAQGVFRILSGFSSSGFAASCARDSWRYSSGR